MALEPEEIVPFSSSFLFVMIILIAKVSYKSGCDSLLSLDDAHNGRCQIPLMALLSSNFLDNAERF